MCVCGGGSNSDYMLCGLTCVKGREYFFLVGREIDVRKKKREIRNTQTCDDLGEKQVLTKSSV